MPTPLENRAALAPERFATLTAVVSDHRSIKHALDWSLGLSPPVAPTDAVAQDEFSHDILFELPDCWLVYDCS